MADEFCFSLLHATTLQIIRAAGFDSGNAHSTHVLTDIFQKYIELTVSTVAAYSHLNGRTDGNFYDLKSAFEHLEIDLPSLQKWLSEESTSLIPSWTDQGDPSRILEGITNADLDHQDPVTYYYGDSSSIGEFHISEEDELQEEKIEDVENHLPEYIPSYFPPFPMVVSAEENETVIVEPESVLPSLKITSDALPLPNIVKKKSKPIENPFTHLKPLDESIMTAENEEQPEMLSLTSTVDIISEPNNSTSSKDVTDSQSPVAQASNDSMDTEGGTKRKISEMLLQAIDLVNYNEEKAQKRRIAQDTDAFNKTTRDLAAPGNTMFSQEPKILDRLVIGLASAIAIPKLMTPSLLMDVAEQPEPVTPSSTIRLNLSGLPNRDSSLLGGNESQETPTESPLSLKTAASSNLNTPVTAASNSSMTLLEELASKPSSIKPLTLSISSVTNDPTSNSNRVSPISLAHLSSTSTDQKTSKRKSLKSKKKLTISLPKPKTDLKLVIPTFASKQPPPSAPIASIVNEKTKNEATLNSVPSAIKETTNPEPSSAAAKIRFKIKLPEPSNSDMDTPPSSPQNTPSADVINCICEHPTLDYGTFMIACDTCGVWFHGLCVGIAESDQINEWNCSRCCITSPAN